MLTRGEDINTLAKVREVSPLITQGRSTDGDGLLGGGGRVGASIPVVVTCSDSEVHAGVDSPIYGIVQSLGLATTQRHVGNGTFVLGLPGGGVFSLSSGELARSPLGGPQNTTDDIRHGATSVGTQNLDGKEIDSLSNTVLARTDGTSTVSSVTVSVLVDIILRDGLAPGSTTLKLDVVNVDTGVYDVHINTLAARRVVLVEGESSQTELLAVRNTRQALRDGVN